MKSAYQMLKSFVREAKEYAKAGAPHVDPDEYRKRIEACMSCPFLKKEVDRCGICGCLVEHKAKWATSSCPDNPKRWDKTIIGSSGVKVKIKGNGKSNSTETGDEVQPTDSKD